MATETHEEFSHRSSRHLRCNWPPKFAKRRYFARQAENQSYIEFLQTPKFNGEEDEQEISSEDADVLSEGDDEAEEQRDKSEDKTGKLENDKNSEVYNLSNIRLFMAGLLGDEDMLQYRDQVEQVASFWEYERRRGPEMNTAEDNKLVALVDERNIGGDLLTKKGYCRPYFGPLTSKQLHEKLSTQVSLHSA
jgi:hypothetical protein